METTQENKEQLHCPGAGLGWVKAIFAGPWPWPSGPGHTQLALGQSGQARANPDPSIQPTYNCI